MAAMFNGRLSTMKAKYSVNEGDLKVIRPLVYTRERQTRDFAYSQVPPSPPPPPDPASSSSSRHPALVLWSLELGSLWGS
eukprot:1963985-Rhodomonas_salina.2